MSTGDCIGRWSIMGKNLVNVVKEREMRIKDTSQICNFLRQKCVAKKILGGERC